MPERRVDIAFPTTSAFLVVVHQLPCEPVVLFDQYGQFDGLQVAIGNNHFAVDD